MHIHCGANPVTIDVDMTEYKFTPHKFTVPTEAEITVNLRNPCTQHHEFRILVFGAKVDEDVDKDRKTTRYWSNVLFPGESKTLSFDVPSKPGKYVIKCRAPGYTEAGMVGTLWVK